jgi:hypothetical protein
MDVIQETEGHWKLKQEALDRTVWKTPLEAVVDLS